MHITELEQIKEIGAEFGWTRGQIEIALANAIRLCYIDKDQMAEADVNLEFGTISVRRRNGYADKGNWVDIDKPLMPNVKMFLEVMEMTQWADGAPGRVLEGEVAGHRDGGVIYRVGDNHLLITPELLSVSDFHKPPEPGTKQVLALCASRDEKSGLRMATRRGKEFVAAVVDAYYPDCVTGIWMGASNSWAVIRMHPDHMSTWLEKGGMNVKHLQEILGLRRITLIPTGKGETEQECKDSELKHFVNNAWRACQIVELEPRRVMIQTPAGEDDPRKLRTFSSMLKKIAPEREQVLL